MSCAVETTHRRLKQRPEKPAYEDSTVIKVIKSGVDADVAADFGAKVKHTVEATLKDIETRGDAAVRELSEKFDKWSPESFRLSDEDIAAAVARVPADTIEDIKFA